MLKLFLIPAFFWGINKIRKIKAAYDLVASLQGVRIITFSTGFAILGIKFRLTNKNNITLNLENYVINVIALDTIIATGTGNLKNVTIPAYGETDIEFQIKTGNYSLTFLQLLYDIIVGNSDKKLIVDYCLKVNGLPKYCDKKVYNV